jgi:hypothetical protein
MLRMVYELLYVEVYCIDISPLGGIERIHPGVTATA